MRSATASQRLLACILLLLLCSLPLAAQADAIQFRMVTRVGLGQKPKLEITALQNLERVEVMLNREDGKNVGQNLGAYTSFVDTSVMTPDVTRNLVVSGGFGNNMASNSDPVSTRPSTEAHDPAIISPSSPRFQTPDRCARTPASAT